MGKNNRARRAAKKRQRGRGSRFAPPQNAFPDGDSRCSCGRDHSRDQSRFGPGDAHGLHEPIVDATSMVFWSMITDLPRRALHLELSGEVARHHDELADADRAAVQDRISEWLANELPEVWERNWTPNDMIHACTNELDDAHAALLGHIIVERAAGELSRRHMPRRWGAELDALAEDLGVHRSPGHAGSDWLSRCAKACSLSGPDLWAVALGIMRLFVRLPGLNATCPPPSEWVTAGLDASTGRSGVDSKLLDKVRALLAKAESTNFEEEADALTAKAQQLIARHAIDAALIDPPGDAKRATPELRRYWLENPYADAKSVLLARVAAANRCESVYSPDLRFSTVIGFGSDLDVVELLFTSLLVQGSSAVHAAGSVRDRSGRSRTRSFRSSFWLSFALRIGERLTQVADEVVDDAVSVHGRSLLPVLALRENEVRDAVTEAFPGAVTRPLRFSNSAGYQAGRVAADQADLAAGERLRKAG